MSTPEPDGTTSSGVGIKNPHPHDVLSGRGGASNNHIGNAVYRTIVEHNKALYKDLPRADKSELACSIVDAIYGLDPPGRFLERRAKKKKAKGGKKKRRTKSDDDDDLWYEIDKKHARDKTAQALREKVHKARTIPAEQVPVSLRHFLRDGFDGGAPAAPAAATGMKGRGGSRAAAASKRSGGAKRKAGMSGGGDAYDGGSSDDGGGSDRSASGGGGAPTNGGSSKKLRLDPRFFFRGTSLSTSMRNLGKGVGGGGGLRSPLDWTQRFSSTSEHDKAADESDADKKDGAAAGGQRIEPLPLPHMPPKAPLHETGTRDKSFCPETALQDSPSLFDFFSNFRQSTRSLFGGSEPAPLPPATAATSSAIPRGRGLGGGDATPRAGQKPSAAAATAATETGNEEALALDAALPQPGGGSKRRRARTALTHSAVVANNASPSPVERTSTLTSDISSFLPSFLERGATAVLDHIGPPVASLGRAVTSMFGMGSPSTSQSSQEGSLREAGAGAGPLASPRPMALTRNDRESTLMRDDEEEETEFEKRLRVVPPSSMRASSV